jgi:hypothetical protein
MLVDDLIRVLQGFANGARTLNLTEGAEACSGTEEFFGWEIAANE